MVCPRKTKEISSSQKFNPLFVNIKTKINNGYYKNELDYIDLTNFRKEFKTSIKLYVNFFQRILIMICLKILKLFGLLSQIINAQNLNIHKSSLKVIPTHSEESESETFPITSAQFFIHPILLQKSLE